MSELVFFEMIILIPIILILFAITYRTYYYTKDPRLNEYDKKALTEKMKKQEIILYIFNLFFLLIVISSLYNHKKIIVLVSILLIGLSIICIAIKKIKISNILCVIIIVPTIIISIFSMGNAIIKGELFKSSSVRALEISTLNSRFTQYESNHQTGIKVKELINEVICSNSKGEQISIKGDLIVGSDTNFDVSAIKDDENYKVMVTRYNSEGYVEEITITKAE